MESWCFDSLEKSFVSNQTVLPKNVIIECDFKTTYSDFPPEGIAEILAKQYDPKNVEYNDGSIDEISCLKHGESSLVDCSSRDSSLIDLKLGGVSDHNLSYNLTEVANPALSSAESTITAVAKRARGVGMSSQSVYCLVYGCNKDLSSAKDYHKRHKVCDVHSKTARVVVNGIEQRFCQQCSRFHLLAEFDDGKRSCRKRLAGHNERRRKPHVGFGRNRSGRSLHSYTGSISGKFQGTTLAATSFICQDILGPTHGEKQPSNCWNRGIKLENEASTYGHLDQKTMLPHYLFQKQYTSAIDNRVYADNINHYSCDQTNGVGSEDLTLYDTVSTIHGIPGMSESGCALSLLSSQSHNSHTSNTSIVQTSCPQFGTTELYGDVDVHGLSCGDGTTIDLLQLSSQLQRVENQRQSMPVKQDNGRFLLF